MGKGSILKKQKQVGLAQNLSRLKELSYRRGSAQCGLELAHIHMRKLVDNLINDLGKILDKG